MIRGITDLRWIYIITDCRDNLLLMCEDVYQFVRDNDIQASHRTNGRSQESAFRNTSQLEHDLHFFFSPSPSLPTPTPPSPPQPPPQHWKPV